MKIAIRVDASVKIGTGHVMRCLTLAEELKHNKAEVVFICRELPGHMADLIERKGFSVNLLSLPDKKKSEIDVEPLSHAEWLAVPWEYDARETHQVLEAQKHCDWLVVDHYAIDEKWEKKQRDVVSKIMVVDDLADRIHDCDLLLDQNFYLNPEERYSQLVPLQCKGLLGPKYALLRKEFTEKLKIKDCNEFIDVKRLFLFMGGSDLTNETEKTIRALDKLLSMEIIVDVVVSSVNPRADEIKKMCSVRDYCHFHKDVTNISELMLEADIAIGAGGATTLERCYIGLPSQVIMVADNQKETTLALNEVGALSCIGWYSDITSDDIFEKLRDFINKSNELRMMCKSARKIFGEGNYCGINGVVSELLRSA